MKRNISLSVFFPAYNEEANIAESIRQAQAALSTLITRYEIIIVNDGSNDKTGKIADSLAKTDDRIRVVHHNPNRGYGAAVWSGIKAARYDYVFFTDADLQFDLNEIKNLLEYIPEYDAVIGYRAKRQDPLMRIVNAKGWNILNRLLFGLKVKDIDCAFKLFKREVLIDIEPNSKGAMLSAELLIRLQRKGVKFKEIAVTHLPRKQGSPTGAKPSVILRAFRELFQTYRGELGNVTHRQVVKFALVGVVNTLIDLGIYFLLTRFNDYFSSHLVTAKTVSFIVGSIISFVANRTWTFRRQSNITIGEVGRFYATVGVALIINATSLLIFLRLFAFRDIPAVLLATLVTFGWNFIASKFWVFANRRHKLLHITVPPDDLALLFLMILVVSTGIVIWGRMDSYPPHWDMAVHLRNSLTYTDAFQQILDSQTVEQLLRKTFVFFVWRELYYPPLTYWVSVPFILWFGRTFDAAILSNIVFLTILVFTLYAIGRKLWDRQTGLLAALVIITFPFITAQFHEFQLDMPLTALTALTFWGLLQTERWRNFGWAFIFGGIAGLGMLTKWPLPAFIIGPVIYELVGRGREIITSDNSKKIILWRNLAIGLLLSALGLLVVAGPWYITHLDSLRQNLGINWQTGTGEGDPNPLSFASLRLYMDVLIQAQIRLLMLVPIVIGLIITATKREALRKNGVVIAMLIGGYLIMTLYNNKDYRFIEPIMSGVALIAVFWIPRVIKPWRTVIVSILIAICVFQFLSIGWGKQLFPFLPEKVVAYVPDVQEGRFRLLAWEFTGYGSGPPRNQQWYQNEVIDSIISSDRNVDGFNDSNIRVAMYYKDNPNFNRENIQYVIAQKSYDIRVLDALPATWNCNDTDYIIATSKDGVAEHVYNNFPLTNGYPLLDQDHRETQPMCQLQTIYQTVLPSGDTVFVWKIIDRLVN